MNTEWSLDELYTGLDDPAYEADIAKLQKALEKEKELVANTNQSAPSISEIEALLRNMEEIETLRNRVGLYVELRQSVNTEDGELMAQMNRLIRLMAQGEEASSARQKIFAAIPDIAAMAAESPVIMTNRYLLQKAQKEAAHLLSDETEAVIAAMDMTGGNGWGNLQSYLTSTVRVPYRDETLTLSQVRNLAYNPDADVRKDAYGAELAAYEQIADSVAFSLNNIKAQVNMLCEKRGYGSPLEMTLEQSGMTRETLDAMMCAIQEYLPVFHKYLRHKGKMLGHENGLPWYDLYAPMGKADETYTVEEARDYLVDCFRSFSDEMADMMAEAFNNSWIDFYPRKGKQGGAFCASASPIHQSRILTNFDGHFGSVGTLAHELGHAYHNKQLESVGPLQQGSPMQVAETASTFNEVHLGKHATRKATGETRLNLLENDLQSQTQCIVDIYSRYLFETAVFEESSEKFLMAEDLKERMLDAQRRAYGDGLDPEYLHPYMWVNKSHYYSSGLSFYNFPYAFGNLFALGLYSLYEKEGDSFIPKYNKMLASTGCMDIEQIGQLMDIDLTKPDFWRESLAQIAAQVEEFCNYK